MSSRRTRDEQLGMSFSKANTKLNRTILFRLVQLAGLDHCYRCGKSIERVDNLSIEHKEPWLHSDDPVALFFNLDNVCFSHAKCNFASKRHTFTVLNTNGFKGVQLTSGSSSRPWRAHYYMGKKRHIIGRFATAEDAARAYDSKVTEVYGERAVTNARLGLL